MSAQVMRMLGTAISRNIGWRCDNEPADRCNQSCDKRWVFQNGDAQGGIESIADQVGVRIGEMKIDCDIRIAAKELRQQGRDPARTKGQRGGQLHEAARTA